MYNLFTEIFWFGC